MFLTDYAEFTQAFVRPVLKTNRLTKPIANIGNSKVGNVFLKRAQDITRELPNGKLRRSFGIANSGRTIRKTPLALAGLGAAGYGAYRTKKVYDKYKPEIKMGRKAMKTYSNLKNRFNRGDN